MADLTSFLPAILGLIGVGSAASIAIPRTSSTQPAAAKRPTRRSYDTGTPRFMGDLLGSSGSGNYEVLSSDKQIRLKARSLEQNSPQVFGLLRNRRTNILGHQGIRLECQIKNGADELDEPRNTALEKLWRSWCRKENCSLDGSLSFAQILELADRRRFVDGGILIRRVNFQGGRHKAKLALELIEIDRIDDSISRVESNGNTIESGIERSPIGRVVAYHIRNHHPGDRFSPKEGRKTERISASEFIHFFKPIRPGQTKGMSELVTTFQVIRHLDKYQEAELIASRAGANYFAVIESEWTDTQDPKLDEDGNEVAAPEEEFMSPATMKRLFPGEKFTGFTPNRPNSAFADFWRALQRTVSISTGQSYEAYSGDYSQSNFSSTRQALVSERDNWRCEQSDLIQYVVQQVWEWFLDACLAAKLIDADHWLANEDDYRYARWITRTWDWIDPARDIKSIIDAINNGLTTLTDEVAKQGGDIYEIARKKAREKKLADQYGISLQATEGKPEQDSLDPEEEKNDKAVA